MKFFEGCRTAEAVKIRFRILAQEHHPDHIGGDTEVMKAVIAEMEIRLARFIQSGVDVFTAEKGWRPDVNAQVFASVISKIIELNITIEIIGYWIFIFDSYQYRAELKEMGFWFSKTHKSWVYSGTKKRNFRTKHTTEDIRDIHGSSVVCEHEEQAWLTA